MITIFLPTHFEYKFLRTKLEPTSSVLFILLLEHRSERIKTRIQCEAQSYSWNVCVGGSAATRWLRTAKNDFQLNGRAQQRLQTTIAGRLNNL